MESSALLPGVMVGFTALLEHILAIDKENGTYVLKAIILVLIVCYTLVFSALRYTEAKQDYLLYVNIGWIALMTLLFIYTEKLSLTFKQEQPTSDTEQGAENH